MRDFSANFQKWAQEWTHGKLRVIPVRKPISDQEKFRKGWENETSYEKREATDWVGEGKGIRVKEVKILGEKKTMKLMSFM